MVTTNGETKMKTRIVFDGSSCLAEATYNVYSQELDLVFKANERKHYIYEDVGPNIVGTLVGCDSPGVAYHVELGDKYPVRTYEEA